MRVPLIHRTDEQVPDLAAVPTTNASLGQLGLRFPASVPARREHAPAVLAFLRGIDAADTTPSGLGMRRPAALSPQPRPSQTQLAAAAQLALHTVVVAYEDAADDVEILLATLAELAPFADAVKAGC